MQYFKTSIVGAFIAGILVTLGFKDLYPDLELRYRRWRRQRLYRGDGTGTSGPVKHVYLQDDENNPSTQEFSATSDSDALPLPLKEDIKEGIEGTIGLTPLIRIKSLSEATGCNILAKAEFLNGAGNSPKDRVALSIISNAEEAGLLRPHTGDTVYEGTVGSTGISLATICRARGYKVHICMPSDQSIEKRSLLQMLGAEVSLNDPVSIVDPSHYVNRARSLAETHEDRLRDGSRGFFANQFETEYNYLAHRRGTGPEIFAQTGGQLDAFVAGAGTGGTISGVAMFLKERVAGVKVVLADPQGSGLYNKVKYGVMFSATEREGTRRRHQVDSIVEGIGVNRVTQNFEKGRSLVDDAIKVTDEQAMKMARWLVERDGMFVGSSSAVNVVAAVKTALGAEMGRGSGKTIVTILCDSGMRHLSRFWKQASETKEQMEITLDKVLAD